MSSPGWPALHSARSWMAEAVGQSHRHRGRAAARRRPSQDRLAVVEARARRGRALVAAAVRAAAPDQLSHAWVAERIGLPEGYLVWLYPTTADLAAVA